MILRIKKLHPNATVPTYATDGAACFDLHAATASDDRMEFDTGLAFEVPADHVMLVFSRSGHGFKDGATLVNSVGVIDSDYRGSVRVKLTAPVTGGVGARIAQAMVLPVQRVSFVVSDDLSDTARGTGGLGSTGQ